MTERLFDDEPDPPAPPDPRMDAARAHARRDDRQTSHDAARGVGSVGTRQAAVLQALRAADVPVTHEQLIALYRKLPLPAQTDQSIRSRCAELVDKDLVVAVDRRGITTNGRPATRWRAA